jgi:hypothetical protein
MSLQTFRAYRSTGAFYSLLLTGSQYPLLILLLVDYVYCLGVANNKVIQKEALDNESTKSEDSTEDPASNEVLTLQRAYNNDRVCHRCDEGAVEDQKMLSCDYCPLHWHLNCLISPMASPSNTHKWMCPNHPDLVLVGRLTSLAHRKE